MPRTTLDFVLVVASSLVLTGVFLYLLQLWDVIHFTGRARAIGAVPNYLYYHLRSSIFFFTANLLFFLFSLRALARRLDVFLDSSTAFEATPQADRKSRLASIYSLDTRTDMAITTFFGIGVIYTAIGMESALLTALGGIRGAEDAARQGAWEILRKLVDGGLILALSTTICGGIGGYALRLLKLIRSGIRDEGRLLILEAVPQGRQEANPQKAFMDLMMLALVRGRERTEEQLRQLLARAGFKLKRVVRTETASTIVEARPA